jgi:ABC-2 type transport system permease protein
MYTLLQIELFKIFRQPRTYIAFAAIASIVLLIQLALYVDGEKWLAFGMQPLTASFTIEGKILNGYLVCFIVLQTLLIHVPLLIALVAGDMVAGEANMGTLRLLVTKPIGRTRLLLSKFCAAWIYTLLLLIWMGILALLLSVMLFGTGDLIILKSEEVVILEKTDVLWRYFAAFGFAALAMTTVAALAFIVGARRKCHRTNRCHYERSDCIYHFEHNGYTAFQYHQALDFHFPHDRMEGLFRQSYS